MGACGTTCGITKERERELPRARSLAARVHPRLVWTRSRAEVAPVVSHDALRALAAKLEELLPVSVIVHLGNLGECDSLYVLAGLHRPCLRELAEERELSAHEPLPVTETYVRVAISPHGRFASLQEIVATGTMAVGGTVIELEPQAGVVDRRLQGIVKGLQGALRNARLVVLDLAALLLPVDAPEPSPELVDAFDEPLSLWPLLFEGASPMASRASWLPHSSAAQVFESAG